MGDCSLRIKDADMGYDNGGWVCQVTASKFRDNDTLISRVAQLVVRGECIVVHACGFLAPPSIDHVNMPVKELLWPLSRNIFVTAAFHPLL